MKKMILILILLGFTILSSIDIYDINEGQFLKNNADSLQLRASAHYKLMKYEVAAEAYIQYLQNNISDVTSIYNLACCYGLLDREDLAVYYLEIAIQKGYNDVGHINADPDFDSVRDGEIFTNLLNSIEVKQSDENVKSGFAYSSFYNPYIMKLPDDFDENETYDLIIALHGYGDKAENFARLFDEVNAIVVIPETAYPFKLGNSLGYSWSADTVDEAIRNDSFANSVKLVEVVILEISDNYHIDNVLVTGFSQGAGLTYLAGLKFPHLIDMIAPFAGFYPQNLINEQMLDNAAQENLQIFIGHGEEDPIVNISESYKAKETFDNYGIFSEFKTYSGGHRVDKNSLDKVFYNIENLRKKK